MAAAALGRARYHASAERGNVTHATHGEDDVRRLFALPVILTLTMAAACAGPGGSPAAPTASPTGGQPTGGQPTPSAAQPTAGQPTAPPVVGGNVVAVTLTGGADAGAYTGAGQPNCSADFVGPGVWGVQYSIAEATADQLSSVQLVWRPESTGSDDEGMFAGVQMLLTVAFGPLFGEGYREYKVEVRTDGEDSTGTGTVVVTDAGSTAVIHATGTTAEGVAIDATVNCPTVIRG